MESYVAELETFQPFISGYALYDTSEEYLKSIPSLLPLLLVSPCAGPHEILDVLSKRHIDFFLSDFVTAMTDAGEALNFASERDSVSGTELPISLNMWASEFGDDQSPISERCGCHTCENYSRAYVRHLLDAKEMSAWVLLQVYVVLFV